MPEYADHFRTQTRAPLLMVLAVAMLLAACQPNPVLSKIRTALPGA
jgi:hypothetical protein